MDEEKAKLNTEIDALRQELRKVQGLVDANQGELVALETLKKNAISLADEAKETLRLTMNEISDAKLAWAQQKDSEEKSLDAKKAKVDEILAKEASFEAISQEIEEKKLANEELLKKDAAALEEMTHKETECKVILRQAEAAKQESLIIAENTAKKIENYSKNLSSLLEKTITEVSNL